MTQTPEFGFYKKIPLKTFIFLVFIFELTFPAQRLIYIGTSTDLKPSSCFLFIRTLLALIIKGKIRNQVEMFKLRRKLNITDKVLHSKIMKMYLMMYVGTFKGPSKGITFQALDGNSKYLQNGL